VTDLRSTVTAPSTTTSADVERRLGVVGTFVDAQVSDLQFRFLRVPQEPSAVAALAVLGQDVGDGSAGVTRGLGC
jgi:hypothetical protein